jgi:dihydrofolate reductase
MDWIQVNEEIFDYVGKRISQTDTALYGRVTYQMMENYWPHAAENPAATKHDIEHSKWYHQAQKIVLSKTMSDTDRLNRKVISDHLSDHIQELKQSGNGEHHEILLFGSPTATHTLIDLNLIDGYWLFVNPILLGKGIPLFTNQQVKTKLQLQNTCSFTNGVVELNYWVEKP